MRYAPRAIAVFRLKYGRGISAAIAVVGMWYPRPVSSGSGIVQQLRHFDIAETRGLF